MSKKSDFLKKLRDLEIPALNKELQERYAKLRDLRFDLGFGKVSNLKSVRAIKKEIAQILTVSKQKPTTKNKI